MPPTFLLVLGFILLGLAAPVLLVAAFVATMFPLTRPLALHALRVGALGAAGGLVLNVVLQLVASGALRTITPEGALITTGAGFTVCTVASLARRFWLAGQ